MTLSVDWVELKTNTEAIRITRKGGHRMEAKGIICQSCGMPMQKDEDFGTDADGTKNGEFCHFCFKDGGFIDEGITMEQKIDKLVDIAAARMKIPREQVRAHALEIIPTLKRWSVDK